MLKNIKIWFVACSGETKRGGGNSSSHQGHCLYGRYFCVSICVLFLSVFLWVFLVSISFCQYLLSVFLSAICIYFLKSVFWDSVFFGQHFFGSASFGLYFFGTAWFLGSVYCQCSFCKLEKYAFSINWEKNILLIRCGFDALERSRDGFLPFHNLQMPRSQRKIAPMNF